MLFTVVVLALVLQVCSLVWWRYLPASW